MKLKDKFRLLSRWWRFPFLRSYQWESSLNYWWFKRKRELLNFQFKKSKFKARSLLRESANNTSIFGHLILNISTRFIFSVALVFVFFVIDRHLGHWTPTRIPSWLHLAPVREAQREFLTTLGAISAAILTLYFTALSVVVSTAYSRTPGIIRSLMIKEEVGSVYFGILAQFAGVVIVMLTCLAFGYQIGTLNTLLASFLCLFSIFGFVFLGVRAFEYFDPTMLVSLFNRRMLKEIQSVTPSGFQWKDASFQAHHQKQAGVLLGCYSDLVTIASQTENLLGKGLVELGQGLLLIVNYYAQQKVRIPSNSFWFRRTYKHKNWLLTSSSELEMALMTGTTIQPDTVADLTWFETDAAKILEEIFFQLGERRDSAGTIALATSLQSHMRGMSQCLAVEEALKIFKAVVPKLRSQSASETIPVNEIAPKAMNRLAISEIYGVALINVLLGFTNELEKLKAASLGKLFQSVNWLETESLYTGRILPRRVIQEFEFLQGRLDFEHRAEGKIISPEWMQTEMVALAFVRVLDGVTKLLVDEFEITFGNEAEAQLDGKNFVLVAQLVQRGLEGCDKLSKHFADYKTWHAEYTALNRSGEYDWPKIEWDLFHQRIASLRERLVKALAKSSNQLAEIPESESWPDFFGHAYTVLAEECFIAMASGKEDLFQVVFPPFFNLVLHAKEKLRQKFIGDAQNIRLSLEPLADLMALSGFAAVFSELETKRYWSLVEQCWNKYFSLYVDDGSKEQFFKLLCFCVEPNWRLAPRSIMRTRWQQMFDRYLRAHGFVSERALWEGYPEKKSSHPSLLVRFVCRSSRAHTDMCDVFLALYVFKRPESAGIEKPHDVDYLQRALSTKADDETDPSPENE
jgi:hypothetical protein